MLEEPDWLGLQAQFPGATCQGLSSVPWGRRWIGNMLQNPSLKNAVAGFRDGEQRAEDGRRLSAAPSAPTHWSWVEQCCCRSFHISTRGLASRKRQKKQQELTLIKFPLFKTLCQCIYLWKPIYIHIPNHRGVRKIYFLAVGIHAECQIDDISDSLFHLSVSPHFKRNRQWSDGWARSHLTKIGPHLSVCADKLLKQWENKTSLFWALESSFNKVWGSRCPAAHFLCRGAFFPLAQRSVPEA